MESTKREFGHGIPVRELEARLVDPPTVVRDTDRVRIGTAPDNDLVLPSDPRVSRYHVEVRRVGERIKLVDRSTNGTWVGPCHLHGQFSYVAPGATMRIGESQVQILDGGFAVAAASNGFGRLLARSDAMRRVFADAERVAQSDVAILIQGESGTGKELLAEGIHRASSRSNGAFVTVDCGALAPQLVASELFGHERGAFTGADRRHEGAFERAHGGTLFLDEIGELPAESQAMLLGVLERRVVQRVGGKQAVPVDVRILAATHRDLHSDVNEGRFRHDLFYRLAVVRLELPPLRERPEDILFLARHFLDASGHASVDVLDEAGAKPLERHPWSGNVRELRNWVMGSVALGRALPLAPRREGTDALELPFREAKSRTVERFERAYFARLLERTGGNVRAASRLGEIDRSHLITLLKKYELSG